MRSVRRSQKWRMLMAAFFSNSERNSVVIKKPLRKKKVVTPKPPGTNRSRPACAMKTSRKLTARNPSSDGMWPGDFDTRSLGADNFGGQRRNRAQFELKAGQ